MVLVKIIDIDYFGNWGGEGVVWVQEDMVGIYKLLGGVVVGQFVFQAQDYFVQGNDIQCGNGIGMVNICSNYFVGCI